MLREIRKMANNIGVRIFLGVVVFAFIGFGIKDVLQATNNFDLVTFSDAKNITEQAFLKAKSEEIAIIQKQNNLHLTDEDIKELEIDQIILQRLINSSIFNHITQYYDLNLSENTVIQFIKQAPIFNNSYGEFDIQIFHSVIRNSYQKEEEYLQRPKEEILKIIAEENSVNVNDILTKSRKFVDSIEFIEYANFKLLKDLILFSTSIIFSTSTVPTILIIFIIFK
jgi:hypothetical protein